DIQYYNTGFWILWSISKADTFVSQILLHDVTYADQFPTDSSKVAFAVSLMMYYTATWSQPYLTRVFNTDEVVFDKFLDDFSLKTSDLTHSLKLQHLNHFLRTKLLTWTMLTIGLKLMY
ncbi:uncharacterized protein VP01_9234g1, partial [Puccinia sorghi]